MIGKIIPDLEGKLDGMALRVPIPCGSITDLTCEVKSSTTVDEVKRAFHRYAEERGNGVLAIAPAPLVSRDIVRNRHSCILASEHTNVIDGRLVKVMGWYDNEWGFSARLLDMVQRMA